MRVKNLRSDLKKLDSFTLETLKNHLIRNFLRNGRLRVKDLHIRVETFFVLKLNIYSDNMVMAMFA